MPALVEDDQQREAEEDQQPVHTLANPPTSSSVRRAGLGVDGEEVFEVGRLQRRHRGEDALDRGGDRGEADLAVEEGGHRDLVGGVEDAGRRPPGPAGLDREPQAGEGLQVRLLEGQLADRRQVEPRHVDVGALRVVQRVGDRHPHVGVAEVGQGGAVVEVDQRVDDRLRVDDDLDPLEGDAEEVVRLDRLEALVHQRRRVDRDPPAHAPGRVGERLLDADARRGRCGRGTGHPRRSAPAGRPCPAAPPRSAGRGPSARSRPAAAARPVASASAIVSSPPITRLSLLARATSIPSPRATIVGPSPAAPTIPLRTRSAPEETISSRIPSSPARTRPSQAPPAASAALGIGERDRTDPVLRRLSQHPLPARPGGKPDHVELIGRGDDLQRLRPDRPGRPENQQLLHLQQDKEDGSRGRESAFRASLARTNADSSVDQLDR